MKLKKFLVTLLILLFALFAIPLITTSKNKETEVKAAEVEGQEVTVIMDYRSCIHPIEDDGAVSPLFSLTRDEEGNGIWQIGAIKPIIEGDYNTIVAVKYMEAEAVDEKLYIGDPAGVRVRTFPNILYDNIHSSLAYGDEVHLVGKSDNGWGIIEINQCNYFIWAEYLTNVKPVIETEVVSDSFGYYELTAYCNCVKCCGQWAGGPTKSGKMPVQGRTVGCNSIPLGTKIKINGHVYTVEDTGNMPNNVIDIYFDSHTECLAFGRQKAEIFKVN